MSEDGAMNHDAKDHDAKDHDAKDHDERLAAWLDGAMSPEEADAFAAELAGDPALAAKAEAWAANDSMLAGVFEANERPIDDELLARLGLGPLPAAANDNPPRRFGWFAAGTAMAASVAAALMFNFGTATPADDLSGVLERTASLSAAKLADGRTVTPLLTVRAADGRWCREFREGADTTALACRGEAGRWTVEGRAGGGAAPDPDAIAVASGADSGALEAIYQRLGASDPVAAADEKVLIGKGWK